MGQVRVYWAGPLFTIAEREFNKTMSEYVSTLAPNLHFILPQDAVAGLPLGRTFAAAAFRTAIRGIQSADIILAILDGADVDSGTCIEIGYAIGIGKRIVGVRTDMRAAEDQGLNLMVSRACSTLVRAPSVCTSRLRLGPRIVRALRSVARQDHQNGDPCRPQRARRPKV